MLCPPIASSLEEGKNFQKAETNEFTSARPVGFAAGEKVAGKCCDNGRFGLGCAVN